MTVNYHGSDKRYSYVCTHRNTVYGGSSCQCLSGAPLDGFAAEKVLQALEPAALELSLEAAKNIESERAELDGLWQRRVERATYEAESSRGFSTRNRWYSSFRLCSSASFRSQSLANWRATSLFSGSRSR